MASPERAALKSFHFTLWEGLRLPSQGLNITHFARGEGLQGGEGDPPHKPRPASISRRGRVTHGEGQPWKLPEV